MIILIVLLVIFGLSIQIVLTKTHKKNIVKKTYIALNVVLYMDAIATIAFILSVHFGAHIFVKLLFEYLVFLFMGIHFLVYMIIIKNNKQKRKWITFLATMLGLTVVMVFGRYFEKTTTGIILVLILFTRLILVDFKKRYASKYITAIVYLLFMSESVRFITELFITSDLLYHSFSDIWLSAFSFTIRAISTIFIINLHEQLSINRNLAKTLDYQSAAVLLSQVFDQNPNVVILTDMGRRIIYANPQTSILTGYTESELIGKTPKLFGSGQTPKDTYKTLNAALKTGASWVGEFVNRKKNGEVFIEQSKIMTLKDVNGVPVFYLSIKNDITIEKTYLKALEYQSAHDDLTGLLRRQVFIQRFESSINMNHELNHHFILMDIDEFKYINDTYGHLVGDTILIEFSNILKEIFNVKAYICRFGGDEFAVYLYDYEPEEVYEFINKLHDKLNITQVKAISKDYRLKFSYGVTSINLPFDFSHIYESSDKKLYLNKATKNHINRQDKA